MLYYAIAPIRAFTIVRRMKSNMPQVKLLSRPVKALPELMLIGTAEFEAAHQGLPDHDHGPSIEIVVFDKGRNSYSSGGVDYALTGGDFFIAPPHCVHSSGNNPQDKARHAWIQIDLTRPHLHARHHFLQIADGESLRRRLSALPVMKGRAGRTLYSHLHNLYERTAAAPKPPRTPDALTVLDLRTRLTGFLLELLRCTDEARQSDAPAKIASTPAIAHALQYMTENLTVPLTVGQIAAACGYTTSAFKQAFRREMGLSPADYFLRLKIDEAKLRLAAGDRSVTDLAIDLGFASGQYFATAFRRLTTLTPSAWRKQHGRTTGDRVQYR